MEVQILEDNDGTFTVILSGSDSILEDGFVDRPAAESWCVTNHFNIVP